MKNRKRLLLALLLSAPGFATTALAEDTPKIHGGLYLDTAYLASNTKPANHVWRSKGTSWQIDEFVIDNATAFLEKSPTASSRWGFQLGLQAGKDIDGLVPTDPVSSADELKHLYYTNVSYLFPLGGGLSVQGGLIPGILGYESFHAWENPTYARAYGVDLVPYFHWGLWMTYPKGSSFEASFLIVQGWDYLAHRNDVPSYALQLEREVRQGITVKLNGYTGPEQSETAFEYWRRAAEAVAEWRKGFFLLAGNLGLGSEKQATIAGTPTYDWMWGSLWLRVDPWDQFGLTLRPEVYRDPDGNMTGARQTIRAITARAEFRVSMFKMNDLSARLEYRYDRSTGPDGGFYQGDDNSLTANQNLFILALLWRFDTGS